MISLTCNSCKASCRHCMPTPVWRNAWTRYSAYHNSISSPNTICNWNPWNLCDLVTPYPCSKTQSHQNRAMNWNHRTIPIVCCLDRRRHSDCHFLKRQQTFPESSWVRCSTSSFGLVWRRRIPGPNGCGQCIRGAAVGLAEHRLVLKLLYT